MVYVQNLVDHDSTRDTALTVAMNGNLTNVNLFKNTQIGLCNPSWDVVRKHMAASFMKEVERLRVITQRFHRGIKLFPELDLCNPT